MSSKDTVEISAICRDCKKEFSTNVQLYYDALPVLKKSSRFAVVTCPYCGAEDESSIPFLFYSRENRIIYTIFASRNFNSFERTKLLTNKLLEQYLSNSSL